MPYTIKILNDGVEVSDTPFIASDELISRIVVNKEFYTFQPVRVENNVCYLDMMQNPLMRNFPEEDMVAQIAEILTTILAMMESNEVWPENMEFHQLQQLYNTCKFFRLHTMEKRLAREYPAFGLPTSS